MNERMNVKDIVYLCRNNSYVFESKRQIEEVVDRAEIVTILRVKHGKVYYLVKLLDGEEKDFEFEYCGDKLYKKRANVINLIVKENIQFLKHLQQSNREDEQKELEAINQRLKISKHREEHYSKLIDVMEHLSL